MYILKQNKTPKQTTKLRQNAISKSLHQLSLVLLSVIWSPNPNSGCFTQAGERVHKHTHSEHQWLRLSLFHVVVLHLIYTGDWTQWPWPLMNGNDFPPSVVIPYAWSSDTCASSFLRKASKATRYCLLWLFLLSLCSFLLVSPKTWFLPKY